jgi:hypothetical protein
MSICNRAPQTSFDTPQAPHESTETSPPDV